MAWNEPGGGKDPWGNGNQGGPPDLDEVFRNVQSKVTNIFGKGRGGGGSSSSGPGKYGAVGGVVILVVGLIVWLFFGIYIIQPAERGVVTQFGRYHDTLQPGPHWIIPWPIQDLERVNVDQNRSVRMRGQTMLTRDENIVEIDMAVQYNVKNAEDFLFKVRDPDATLQEVAESAVREVIG
ncbi:MAG: protease modulator HflK, partial [Pseudomonadota bacterium]